MLASRRIEKANSVTTTARSDITRITASRAKPLSSRASRGRSRRGDPDGHADGRLLDGLAAHHGREGDLDGAGNGALLGSVPALFPGALGVAQVAEAHGGERRIDDDRRHVLEGVVVGQRLLADGQARLVPSSTDRVTAVKAIGAGRGNGADTVTNDSLSGAPWKRTSGWTPAGAGPR